METIQHSHYLPRAAFKGRGLSEIKSRLVRNIRAAGRDFGFIAVRGTSGMLVGPLVTAALNSNLIVVRKPRDSDNSLTNTEGLPCHGDHKYIILDEFISSGKTVEAIRESLQPHRCVGVFLYSCWSECTNIAARRKWDFTVFPCGR